MKVDVLGVRGSTPASRARARPSPRHHSCVALARDGAPPTLLLEAGTDLRGPGRLADDPVDLAAEGDAISLPG